MTTTKVLPLSMKKAISATTNYRDLTNWIIIKIIKIIYIIILLAMIILMFVKK